LSNVLKIAQNGMAVLNEGGVLKRHVDKIAMERGKKKLKFQKRIHSLIVVYKFYFKTCNDEKIPVEIL